MTEKKSRGQPKFEPTQDQRNQVAGRRRIALVAPTAADARDVMVEGESGILAISPDHERPLYEAQQAPADLA
jgi:phage terminase large subunit-like protein